MPAAQSRAPRQTATSSSLYPQSRWGPELRGKRKAPVSHLLVGLVFAFEVVLFGSQGCQFSVEGRPRECLFGYEQKGCQGHGRRRTWSTARLLICLHKLRGPGPPPREEGSRWITPRVCNGVLWGKTRPQPRPGTANRACGCVIESLNARGSAASTAEGLAVVGKQHMWPRLWPGVWLSCSWLRIY